MDFVRFDNCIVAKTSLQSYCSKHSTPFVILVFMRDFTWLPTVGFSIFSAEKIIADGLHPNKTVAYKPWDTPELPDWTKKPVKKYDYLRILLHFEENGFRVRFRYNMSAPSEYIYFHVPAAFANETYLAVASCEMFDEPNRTSIAILSQPQMIAWMARRQKNEGSSLETADEGKDIGPSAGATHPDDEPGYPMCTWCCERPIDCLLMPCNHAVCCQTCKDNYVNYEMNKVRFELGQVRARELLCPVCRKKVEQMAQIWFPKSGRCLLCKSGCEMLSAVAAGEYGCGCVIGCYEKAQKLCADGGFCPNCGTELDEILQIFVQSDLSF